MLSNLKMATVADFLTTLFSDDAPLDNLLSECYQDFLDAGRGGVFKADVFTKEIIGKVGNDGVIKLLALFCAYGTNMALTEKRLGEVVGRKNEMSEKAAKTLEIIKDLKNKGISFKVKSVKIDDKTVTMGRMFSCFNPALFKLCSIKEMKSRKWSSDMECDLLTYPITMIAAIKTSGFDKVIVGGHVLTSEQFYTLVIMADQKANEKETKAIKQNAKENYDMVTDPNDLLQKWQLKNSNFFKQSLEGVSALYSKTLAIKCLTSSKIFHLKSQALEIETKYEAIMCFANVNEVPTFSVKDCAFYSN